MPYVVLGIDIGIEFDTIPLKKRKTINTISIFDIWKLSFQICITNTGMPEGGGQKTFDIMIWFDITMPFDILLRCHSILRCRSILRNRSIIRNSLILRHTESSTFRYIETSDTISNTSHMIRSGMKYYEHLIRTTVLWSCPHSYGVQVHERLVLVCVRTCCSCGVPS